MDGLVQVKIKGTVITSRYGSLSDGDILRTDTAFARHLVEECAAAEYISPAIDPASIEAERLEAERLEAERIGVARETLQAEIADLEKVIEAAAKKDKPALTAQLAAKQQEFAAL